jgi:hypothetical protein
VGGVDCAAPWRPGTPPSRRQTLAYQAVKYQQRDGWSHRDALRLAHAQPPTDQHAIIFHWMVKGWADVGAAPHPEAAVRLIWAMERGKARRARRPGSGADRAVRPALGDCAEPVAGRRRSCGGRCCRKLPLTALLRNLARMTANGALTAESEALATVLRKLGDGELLRKARIHPIAVLTAFNTYAAGRGMRGALQWAPIPAVIDALDRAFYAAFGNVEATGQAHRAGARCLRVDEQGHGGRRAGADPARRRRGDGAGDGQRRAAGDDRRLQPHPGAAGDSSRASVSTRWWR